MSNIYLRNGWSIDRLPELFAQLEISGGINFGFWPTKPKEKSPQADQPPPPSTRIKEFEFKGGTVREALDELIKSNASLNWEARGHRVVVRRDPKSPDIEKLLAVVVGTLDVNSIPPGSDELVTTLSRAWNKARKRGPDKLTKSMRKHGRYEAPRHAGLFACRRPVMLTPWQEDENQTFADALKKLTPISQHAFWYLIDAEQGPGQAYGRFFGGDHLRAAVTSWSPVRRKLTIAELVRCLDEDYEKLHGYPTKQLRIEDVRGELRRRYHFKAKIVRKALTKGDTIDGLVGERSENAYYHVQWLGSLGDRSLNQLVFARALDVKASKKVTHPLKAFDRPGFKDFDPALIPNWRKVMRNHPSQSMRQYARYVVALYEWYQAGGKNSGEPRPSRPGIF